MNVGEAKEELTICEEHKVEYLQMVQEPICRMSTTAAIFKGFAATIVAGISALAYEDINTLILILSFFPVCLFAILDIYYLSIEKRYRYLYNQIRLNEHPIDFSMELTTNKKISKSRVIDCLKSPSIWLFYPAMIIILIAVTILKIVKVI